MVDVDHFKEVNDRFGHLVGDAALRHISDKMKLCVREADMIARYGGEEFVIILPETDSDGAGYIAERVRKEIAVSSFAVEEHGEIRLTVSIGIACMNFGHEYSDLDRLLQSADDAMYRAKMSGRNCVSYAPAPVNMHETISADAL
jgi:diguanylate cyclase (GGDEF)-like protein